MWEMAPRLPTAGVAHPLYVEGGAHGNVVVGMRGWQDFFRLLRRGKDVPHEPERVAAYPPSRLVAFKVVDNIIGET